MIQQAYKSKQSPALRARAAEIVRHCKLPLHGYIVNMVVNNGHFLTLVCERVGLVFFVYYVSVAQHWSVLDISAGGWSC